ncbi:TIR domain-containing adapter molecule 1 [Hypomesus transpacificus]|uniref:TIR domain-containing adapter molecule 1 n=1 Tax=Hypomesus transpacificus TaxID=137520 RepID=UPI001F07FE70|nr:TIR domain-containing adapter molecule 1 [Hypomesus transpacificus]
MKMEREDRTIREDSIEGGTELVDVFRILSDLPKERLQSLTLKMGNSPAEKLTHAMSLISLSRGTEALDKLQTLEGNGIAKYLFERVNICGVTLNNFRVDRTAMAEDNLIDLARIFKLLAEERLCETFLRDCAYKRALKACRHTEGTCKEGQKYTHLDQLKKEAKKVRGPWIEDVIQDTFSFKNLPSREYCSPLNESNTALSNQSLPSSLQTYISQGLPTHLEISVSEDKIFSKLPPNQVESPAARCFDYTEKDALQYYSKSQVTNGPPPVNKVNTSISPHIPSSSAQNCFPSIKTETNPNTFPKCKINVEEEESVFYSFVILHAEEDIDLAERLKEKLESLNIGLGATFSQDFAIPGRSTLTCIEEAIDNSAFTLLLLSSNFNTRLLEIETNSALMNSINNRHKYNTVIPLHPKENCMVKERMPKLLQILVPLKENEMFEKKAKKAINPAKIEDQRQVWREEQRVKEQMRRKERTREDIKLQMDLIRESKEADKLQQEWKLNLPLGELNIQHSLTSPRPNIHIENASYIIIGNDSKMTVGLDRNSFGDND